MDELTRLYTPDDVAQILGIHPKTVERMAAREELPGIRVGRYWRFDSAELSRWISAKSQDGIDRPGAGTVACEVPAAPAGPISIQRGGQ
jgi:excisionase family DNA binding protein